MIFVCLGTQVYQFDRLLVAIDDLIADGRIDDDVFAQTGHSTYTPKRFKYQSFLGPDEYAQAVSNADLIITHGGTGAIMKGLKAGKQVIAVPRQAKFGEHIDNHQFQVVDALAGEGFLIKVVDMDCLGDAIEQINAHPITKRFHSTGQAIQLITDYIEEVVSSSAK